MEQDLETAVASEPTEPQTEQPTEPPPSGVAVEVSSRAIWLDEAGIEIVRATRSWIQYGAVGFAVLCIIIGAVEGLFGR